MSKISKADNIAIKNETINTDFKEIKNLLSMDASCNNCYGKSFEPSTIDYLDLESVVVQMITNYKDKQYQILENNGMPHDARCVHFSLNTLKTFIYAIENACCAGECKPSLGELGIRFYYAAYNSDLPLPMNDMDISYVGKHTLVLVPTYTSPTNPNLHIDFCPDDFETDENGSSTCIPKSLDNPNTYVNVAHPSTSLSSKRAKKSAAQPKKVMALIGGYPDPRSKKDKFENAKPKKKLTSKTKAKGKARPNDPADPGGVATVHTLMNHGDLVPPPNIVVTSTDRFSDATLLNC